ncbi:hypothetical protein STN0717ENT73_28700 [Enterobacter cloacae]|nr:hypothetical protein P852_02621 [Enterobacter asburiae]BBW46556.1 hypothetical protein STN0717ENT73_28700 [Enterobacter cloacae]
MIQESRCNAIFYDLRLFSQCKNYECDQFIVSDPISIACFPGRVKDKLKFINHFHFFIPFVIANRTVVERIKTINCKRFNNLLCNNAKMNPCTIAFSINRISKSKGLDHVC